jgi:Tfp pilus assembly protein PilF
MGSILQRLFKRELVPKSPTLKTGGGSASPPEAATPAPHSFDEVYARALGHASAGDFAQALAFYDRAVALRPDLAEPYYKRANALKNLGRLDESLASYDQAIALKPDYAHAYCNRGVVQQSLGQLDAALSSYDHAIELEEKDAVAHYNRALLMQEHSRWPEALRDYDRALAIDPEHADAQYNRAMAQLYLGDFEAGWRGYEWRWRNAERLGIGTVRSFVQPRWHGHEPLAGKRILLYCEAGLGDTLQFARYATGCARLGARVILEVQPPLCSLLRGLEGVSQVFKAGSDLPDFDYHCPLLSLPLAFRTTLETIPSPAHYLQANEALVAQWRARLGERRKPRVGLVWSGNTRNPLDARRSIRLADWAPRLPTEFEYFKLQTEVRPADRATLDAHPGIVSVEDTLLDFEGTAALCECLDVILTVDTSLAHLAGALGRPTWVLLAHTPDFRWMRERNDSPWYPTLTLYRQASPGDWSSAFDAVNAALHRQLA